MTTRIELSILQNTNIPTFIKLSEKYVFVNVYIKAPLSELSNIRESLIKLNYTTRLFVLLNNNTKEEYIYGKLKGHKGVFNEHCKNSVWRNKLTDLINVSSNENDTVLLDDNNLKTTYTGKREWIII